MDVKVRRMASDDCVTMSRAFADQGWNKPVGQYQHYLAEQEAGRREVILAVVDGEFAGYLSVVWDAPYPHFRENRIPEITDLNVLKNYRRRGVAARLMDHAEEMVSRRSRITGIGVGLTADYGQAQRLYVKRGYVPDGKGLSSNGQPVVWGETVRVDDDLVLFFTKNL